MFSSNLNPPMDDYVQEWQQLLKHLLGWPAFQISQWIEHQLGDCQPIHLWNFRHETPQYWLLGLLIPPSLAQNLPLREYNRLRSELDGAIYVDESKPIDRGLFLEH